MLFVKLAFALTLLAIAGSAFWLGWGLMGWLLRKLFHK